jgi:DoxX-like family
MHVIYLATTSFAALMVGFAATKSLAGADFVKLAADRVRISRVWMPRLGVVLGSGAVGLVVGFAVSPLGTAAAIGLVAYFICAVGAHLRAGDRHLGGAVFFLLLAAVALAANLAYRNHW